MGQARIPSADELEHLFLKISQNRHPEKNRLIMLISFRLGLRAQEISLLQFKEVVELGLIKKTEPRAFKVCEIMALPASYTKGSNALNRSKSKYERKSFTFSYARFHQMLDLHEQLINGGKEFDREILYPPVKKKTGQSRDLPMVDLDLREAIEEYVNLRLDKNPGIKPTDPLIITQKGGPYSPNTLQEHMKLMLSDWAGIEKASSHSGRRSVLDNIIHKQGKSVRVAQKVAGHKDASTTVRYTEATEGMLKDALGNIKEKDGKKS